MIAKTQTLTVSGALNTARYITDAKHPHHQGKTILVEWLGAAFEGVAKRNREAKFRHEIESAIRLRHTGRPPTVACHHLILSGAPGDGPLRPEERKGGTHFRARPRQQNNRLQGGYSLQS